MHWLSHQLLIHYHACVHIASFIIATACYERLQLVCNQQSPTGLYAYILLYITSVECLVNYCKLSNKYCHHHLNTVF